MPNVWPPEKTSGGGGSPFAEALGPASILAVGVGLDPNGNFPAIWLQMGDSSYRAIINDGGQFRFHSYDTSQTLLHEITFSDTLVDFSGGDGPDKSVVVHGISELAVNHLLSGTGFSNPTASQGDPGLGANSTAAASGTDFCGTLTLSTSASDIPLSNSVITTVTFGSSFASVPTILVVPSNLAATNLTPGTVYIDQGNSSAATFVVSSGDTPIPQANAEYLFNYIVVGVV